MADDPKRVEAALTVMGAGASIRERFKDASRPDWESYKKANQAKMDGTADQDTAMEEYRRQLDREREKKLSRGTNHAAAATARGSKSRKKKKKKRHSSSDSSSENDDDSDDSSSSSSEEERRREKRKKKHKKKHKRKRHHREEDSDDDNDSSESRDSDRKKRKRKKHKKKRDRKDDDDEDDKDPNKEHYRLSSFFNEGGWTGCSRAIVKVSLPNGRILSPLPEREKKLLMKADVLTDRLFTDDGEMQLLYLLV